MSTTQTTATPDPVDGWRPRLVVSDLDGTFLSPDGTVSEVNREAVRSAIASGIDVVFATGRPPAWLDVVAALELPSSLVIASNGALVYDVAADEIVLRHPIAADVLAAVVADLRAALPEAAYGVEDGRTFVCTPDYVYRAHGDRTIERVDVAALGVDGRVVKLLVQHPGLAPDELAARAEAVVAGRLTVTHSAADGWGLLELSAPGISKASTLADWCAERGITAAEVAAFGDMPNDREMLAWAGRPHVMAHAHPSLADLGATVVGSNAESAVGYTLRGWL